MERSGISANQILAFVKRAESDILVLGRGWRQVHQQGNRFTSEIQVRPYGRPSDGPAQATRISVDGKGHEVDNVFVERLWRRLKYENICREAHGTPIALRAGLEP